MSYDADNLGGGPEPIDSPSPQSAAAKARMPGIFLIVIAILNALGVAGCFMIAMAMSNMPEAEFKKALEQQPQNKKQLDEAGITPEQLQSYYVKFFGGTGIAGILGFPLLLVGGIQMCRGRGWGLALTAAVLAMLPGLSPSFCCCGLSPAIGIWALVVLLNSDVKAAFR